MNVFLAVSLRLISMYLLVVWLYKEESNVTEQYVMLKSSPSADSSLLVNTGRFNSDKQ